MRSVDGKRPADGVGSVRALLDPAFGFFLWALHFLFVYCLTAIACAMGWGARAMLWTLVAQVVATLLALAAIGWHAWRATHAPGAPTDRVFMTRLTQGCDAIAAFGVVMMLGPIVLTPGCS